MIRTIQPRLGLAIGAVLLAGLAGAGAQAQGAAQPAESAAPPAAGAAPGGQAEEQLDRTPEDCVLLNRISNNTGVNPGQVVFSMRGGTYYLNVLDGACQALTAGQTRLVFQYRTGSQRISRLCETDTFTVERQAGRLGCGLGVFYPITPAEASALLGKPVAGPPASDSSDSGSNERSERPSRRERD
jgi:hypothetical protein